MTIKTNFTQGGSYNAIDLINQFKALSGNGVLNVAGGSLQVLTTGNMIVNVSIGSCTLNGLFLNSDAIVPISIRTNTDGYNRIDVLSADLDNNCFTITEGSTATAPTVPVLTGNKLALAQIYIGNNVNLIQQNNITDVRVEGGKANISNAILTGAMGLINQAYCHKTDGNGNILFPHDNCMIILFAVDRGAPGNFLIEMGYKNAGSMPFLNHVSSTTLATGNMNTSGTVVITGGIAEMIEAYGISIPK